MARPDPPPSTWTSRSRLFGAEPELELALQPGADGASGWVTWWAGTADSRVLLARASGHGEPRLHMLVIQSDEHAGAQADLDNRTLDSAWQLGIDTYRTTGAALVPCLLATTTEQLLPATTYCVAQGVFFHAFCPESLAPLRTCRDDEVLAGWGLERYSASRIRYSTGQVAGGGPPKAAYTWSRDGGVEAVEGLAVRRRGELYRDYAALWQRDLSAEQRRTLERDFPCWKCSHHEQCYGPAAADGSVVAEDRLLPVNYHDAHAMLLEGMDVSFDGLAALLGGAPSARLLAEQLPAAAQAERRAVLTRHLDGERPWLTPGAHARKPAPEVTAHLTKEIASLKVRTFEQVCRAVAAFQSATGRGHGGLCASRIMVRFANGLGTCVPARWTGEVHLLADEPLVAVAPTAGGNRPRLGLLLARLLIENDARDADGVDALVEDLASRFERGAGADAAPGSLEDWARNLLAQLEEIGGASLLHEQSHRRSVEAAPIATDVWSDLWILVLRLVTGIQGFSLAAADPADMQEVCAQLASLALRFEVDAYGAEAMRNEIATVIAEQFEAIEPPAARTEAN
ncbi:MAG TPA: hypothetical protein VFZ65_10955 [Planctomycetota bacterium]|nr:hypothetical protein [Planctomycetota bacterium]